MGFNPPVPQQDTNWEIRITVLMSLMFQIILIFAAPLRKRSSSAFIRFVIWSCYLLADWVADLALGLLLNNMGNIGGSSEGGGSSSSNSPIIFAFWAPFLLLHLGGPDTITAYSLEDNELWLRHLIGFLFELVAAAVVFFCSLGDNPMILATPIMFISGIIKYTERTYSLYYGSTDGFPVAVLGVPDVRSSNIPKLMQAYSSRKNAGLIVEVATLRDDSSNAVWDMYSGEDKGPRDEYDGEDELNAYKLFVNFRAIFVNGVVSTRNRRMSEAFYVALGSHDPMKAFHILEMELNYMYDMLYTKMPVLNTKVGYVLRFINCCCIISSFIIFANHGKASMLPPDIGITYALLATAVALEAVALVKLLFSNWTLVYILHSQPSKWLSRLFKSIQKTKKFLTTFFCGEQPLTGKKFLRTQQHATWPGTVWQMNLIDHSLRTLQWDNYYRLPKVVHKISHKPIIDRIKENEKKYQDLLTFIVEKIKEIVNNKSEAQRKQACQARGDRALQELKGCFKTDKIDKIESTIIFKSVSERDFDESLFMWHIATDLCLSMKQEARDDSIDKMKTVSKCISEYLLYILIKKPEMTPATVGIGHLRYKNTYEGAKLLLRSEKHIIENRDHVGACGVVQNMDTTTFEDGFIKGDRTKTVLFNASVLAKALRHSFIDQDAMWRVIAHVWMEMLTFTASHTQPREHLKKLSNGGELITKVWLLMAHMGMTSSFFEVAHGDDQQLL
jgi:hypothetical protein